MTNPNKPFTFHQQASKEGYFWVRCETEGFCELSSPPPCWFDINWYFGHGYDLSNFDPSVGYYLASAASHLDERDALTRDVGDYPTLFLDLATMTSSADRILEFASHWGLLTDKRGHKEYLRISGSTGNDKLVQVEPIYTWIYLISALGRSWRYAQLLENREDEKLRSLVDWSDPTTVKFENYLVASPEYEPERLAIMQTGDFLNPARHYIEDGFRKFDHDGALPNLSSELRWDDKVGKWQIEISPKDLRGALWLQFAHALCRSSSFKRCEECDRWLQIGPGAARLEKTYCSNACRMRAYRKRKSKRKKL